ncbi:MAG: hypothetical protein H5U36_10275 [Candidatus Caldatribacterium sp.]|nr:hypothetical protein [Candidatus Caldatribacterium sp.]
MIRTILSLLSGMALSLILLGLIARQVRELLRTRRYSLWRGIFIREGIAGMWLFVLLRYLRVRLNVFVASFLVSYFLFVILFANLFFKGAENCGRGA